MGPNRKLTKLKENNWRASSALLLFSCTPARQLSLAQFSNLCSKLNRSHVNAGLSVPIVTVPSGTVP